jgi:hypothetical protein
VKTVHEFLITNKRIDDEPFEYSWFHSWMVAFAQVESLRGRMGESTRQVEGLFESLLSQSFGG